MEAIFRTNALTKLYKGYAAVNAVNMAVNRGDIYGFIGANGAGKTTLIRMLCGIALPTSGGMELFGGTGEAAQVRNRRRLGVIVETPALMRGYTATEALNWHKTVIGAPKGDIPRLLRLVGLADTGDKKVKDFSLGMRQRLAIAQALIGDPEFLVLDEPANGMDPAGIVETREMLTHLNRELGMTILISSHILSELDKLATKFGIIERGVLMAEREISDLARSLGAAIVVKVSDPAAADMLLKAKGFDSEIRLGSVAVRNFDGNAMELLNYLYSNKIEIESFWRESESLESYFFKVTQGGAAAHA